MRKKFWAVILTATMSLSMAVGVSAANGGDGVNWGEIGNLGANITIQIEKESTPKSYKLGDFFEFYTDTYCDNAKGTQGKRTMEVKAYTGSDQKGVGLVEYKDGGVWKDISGYNTQISFKNDTDRYFHVKFIKNGTYSIRSYFISNDKSMAVSSKIRYVIVNDETLTITREAPEVETTTGQTEESTVAQPNNMKPLGKAKVKSAVKKKSAKKVKITLKAPLKNANGYIVCFYKTKKEAKKNGKPFVKRIYKKNKATFAVSHKLLRKQKKLFVRIRAYQVVDKKMVVSEKWSAVKSVKIGK